MFKSDKSRQTKSFNKKNSHNGSATSQEPISQYEKRSDFRGIVVFAVSCDKSGKGGGKVDAIKKARSLNISKRGMCFETSYLLRENEIIRIMLPLKEINVNVPVLGEVRWIKPVDQKYRVGVSFII